MIMKHLHVYYSPSREMQEMVHYFVHFVQSRGGGGEGARYPVRGIFTPTPEYCNRNSQNGDRSLKFYSDHYETLLARFLQS